MTDAFKDFWAWVGAATAAGFGIIATGLILKDQQGAVNILNAGGNFVGTTVGAFGKLG